MSHPPLPPPSYLLDLSDPFDHAIAELLRLRTVERHAGRFKGATLDNRACEPSRWRAGAGGVGVSAAGCGVGRQHAMPEQGVLMFSYVPARETMLLGGSGGGGAAIMGGGGHSFVGGSGVAGPQGFYCTHGARRGSAVDARGGGGGMLGGVGGGGVGSGGGSGGLVASGASAVGDGGGVVEHPRHGAVRIARVDADDGSSASGGDGSKRGNHRGGGGLGLGAGSSHTARSRWSILKAMHKTAPTMHVERLHHERFDSDNDDDDDSQSTGSASPSETSGTQTGIRSWSMLISAAAAKAAAPVTKAASGATPTLTKTAEQHHGGFYANDPERAAAAAKSLGNTVSATKRTPGGIDEGEEISCVSSISANDGHDDDDANESDNVAALAEPPQAGSAGGGAGASSQLARATTAAAGGGKGGGGNGDDRSGQLSSSSSTLKPKISRGSDGRMDQSAHSIPIGAHNHLLAPADGGGAPYGGANGGSSSGGVGGGGRGHGHSGNQKAEDKAHHEEEVRLRLLSLDFTGVLRPLLLIDKRLHEKGWWLRGIFESRAFNPDCGSTTGEIGSSKTFLEVRTSEIHSLSEDAAREDCSVRFGSGQFASSSRQTTLAR